MGKEKLKQRRKKRKLNQNKKDYIRQKKEYMGSKMNRDLNLLSYVKAINTVYAMLVKLFALD